MNKIKLINGDALEKLDKLIEKGVKVDAIITDPPYNTTALGWDNQIMNDELWEKLEKLSKLKTPIILFGSEPFYSKLIYEAQAKYSHEWIWKKAQGANLFQANYQPMKIHEKIAVFYWNKLIDSHKEYREYIYQIKKIIWNTLIKR